MQHEHVESPGQTTGPEPGSAAAAPPQDLAHAVLALQRSAGNRAVGRLLARRELASGDPEIPSGDWRETDRKRNTVRWHNANIQNLQAGASGEYRQIAERRDFYRWFYEESTRKGAETRWALAASIVAAGAGEVAEMNEFMESTGRVTRASSNEVQGMMRQGNQVIFDNVFPKLKALWNNPLKGQAAVDWDMQILAEEQNLIQPLYAGVSADAMAVVETVAKGGWQARSGEAFVDADEVAPGLNIAEGKVPYFTGDLMKVEDRWSYGMKLAAQFSELSPGTVAKAPPSVTAGYQDGTELAKVDTRPNVHVLEAMIDNDLTDAEHTEAVGLLKSFTVDEQRALLADETFASRASASELTGTEMAKGMSTWTANLYDQLMLLDGWPGFSWVDIQYSEIRPMLLAAPPESRDTVKWPGWRSTFVDICTDATMPQAAHDLGLTAAEANEWIAEENSVIW